ncbi:Transcriptional regulator, contains XRE-family HTH domain [Lampropedia hyalina DSM 16112]|jgi:transcriptional regulator with XRE-family HTH domain|uniref:Transcriptional regulator, contains XRE-family HTH domain n=1 Tax=Lampropedia hyalina DSM 16112 TaxID=1122156 RepID=A0A1M4TPY7_9BURK|nr:helix-turn-helix transcriptional regulator [Lampropedia hyalina]SHE46531.1 Transcriptional regulator, contains XRE-family HTH domain [Lampropedia hyalina DSM 16112]
MDLLAKRLKEARKGAGLSQEKLGVLAGIDEMSASARMNQYERGKHSPDFGTVRRIAAVLNVPTAYFYAETDDLADLLLKFHRLSSGEREQLMSCLDGLAGVVCKAEGG